MAKITDAGLALIAQLQANEDTLIIDKMVYANIAGLDCTQPPPGTETLPDAGDIVRESDIASAGYLNPNTVVYSDVLTSEMGDFSFNWIGLYSTANATLIAVNYMPLQYKYATDGAETGNTICKNFAINYTDIQDLTGITIEAATWQQDLSGLYAALDHSHDYAALDHDHDDEYEPLGAVATHEAAANPHSQYLQSISGQTITAYGVVKADGTKLSGSSNWTVARNSGGRYQLNITDTGNFIVMSGGAYTEIFDDIKALHDQTTGYFLNNQDSNIQLNKRQDGGGVVDGTWIFHAIKL